MTIRGRVLATAGALAAVVVVIVLLVVLTGGDSDPEPIVFDDGISDCREPGRDFGDRCDPGADVSSTGVTHDGAALTIDVELTAPPQLSSEATWRVQINVAAAAGRVCGISNVDEVEGPGETALTYGFDPDFGLDPLTRRPLPPGVCEATLDGARVRFVVDVADQDPAEELRVAGFTLVEFPLDPDRAGSEDDFGFRSSIDALGEG